MAAFIDAEVKALVLVIILIGIAFLLGDAAGGMRGIEFAMLGLGHAARGMAGAHRLHLGHDFEHFEQALGADFGDDGAAMRAHFQEAGGRERMQRFADRRARHAIALGEGDLVEPLTGLESAR